MWELKNDGAPRKIRFMKVATPCRCAICGQYFIPDDMYYIVVCNAIPEATALGLSNVSAHVHCWDGFCNGIEDNTTLAKKLKKHRKPRVAPFTDTQNKSIDAFERAARFFGFTQIKTTRDHCVKATSLGTTVSVVYNPYSGCVTYEDRRKDFLLKGIMTRDISTKVYNKMHELLGDEERLNFNASEVLSNAVAEANRMIRN